MAQTGRSSAKRSKPSYVYTTVGVALVLLIMGIMGWVFLNFKQASNAFKEDIRISVYLRTMSKDSIATIQNFIAAQPFAKEVKFVNKETAKEIWNKENNEDWSNFLNYNPLPESIDFYTKASYVNPDSLQKISDIILANYGNQVADLQYPKSLVTNLNESTGKLGMVFIVVAVVLCLIVIISIDTTIRLSMYSNRFLIKTMQMVGAERWFIARPMDMRAVLYGAISAGIAIVILFALIQWAESQLPQLKAIHNMQSLFILFGGMLLVGIGISVLSTHRSVIKYLKMKLDDLY